MCDQYDMNADEDAKGFTRRRLTLSPSPDGGGGIHTVANKEQTVAGLCRYDCNSERPFT
jgi:hypothetical protein